MLTMRASLPCSLLVTEINCTDGTWNVTDSSIHGEVEGIFTFATASNVSQDSLTGRQNNLTFTDLYPGATYEVVLFYESQDVEQCRHQLTICECLSIWQYLYAHLETFKVCILKMKIISSYMLKKVKWFSFQQPKCQIV